MQYGQNFTVDGFDTTKQTTPTQSNTNTLFFFPTTASASVESFTGRDQRRANLSDTIPQDDPTASPLPASCSTSIPEGGYACSMTLSLPDVIDGGSARKGFLYLTSYYNNAHFRVTMSKSVANSVTLNPVKFDSVQPLVDSTGRANSLFRRVQSRVDLIDTNFPYPQGAVDVTGNFCKDFAVTDLAFIPSGKCEP